MKFRRALLMTAVTLGLAGCASYPMYSQVGVGYYDGGYYGGYRDNYGYGGYGGYPYFGWSAMVPFGGYCPASYAYCPPWGYSAFMDPYAYGFGMFMPYGYGGWYGPYWNGYPYRPPHHGHGHSGDHGDDDHHDDDDDDHHNGDGDHQPPADDGNVPPPAPRPAPWRRGSDRPPPRPDPMVEYPGQDEGANADLEDAIPPPGLSGPMTAPRNYGGRPYRPVPATPPTYIRPPSATPPANGPGPQPSRRELPAPEPRPRAQGPSDDSDTSEPRRGGGKRPRGGASN